MDSSFPSRTPNANADNGIGPCLLRQHRSVQRLMQNMQTIDTATIQQRSVTQSDRPRFTLQGSVGLVLYPGPSQSIEGPIPCESSSTSPHLLCLPPLPRKKRRVRRHRDTVSQSFDLRLLTTAGLDSQAGRSQRDRNASCPAVETQVNQRSHPELRWNAQMAI